MPQAKFLQKSIIDLNIGTYLGVEVFINYHNIFRPLVIYLTI